MTEQEAKERIIQEPGLVNGWFGLDRNDVSEYHHDAVSDFFNDWHVLVMENWSAQSRPGMSGRLYFVFLDVPEEAITLLELKDGRMFQL